MQSGTTMFFCICKSLPSEKCPGKRFYNGKWPSVLCSTASNEKRSHSHLINRWSKGHFVFPPCYIGFAVIIIVKTSSEHVSTILWRAGGTVGFKADRNGGTLLCRALPRPAVCCALRKPDLPAVCPGFGLDMFPGHALHDLSSPKPGHTTGGSGRRSARRTVGRGEAGPRWPHFGRPGRRAKQHCGISPC